MRICNSFNGRWHLSNSCVSHRSARDMSCFAADEGGTGSCCKSANYIETVQVTRLLFRSPLIRWGQILSCERVCGRERREEPASGQSCSGSGSTKFHLSTLRNTSSATATLSQFCSMKGFQSVGYFYLEQNLFSFDNQKYWTMIKLDMRLLYDLLIN